MLALQPIINQLIIYQEFNSAHTFNKWHIEVSFFYNCIATVNLRVLAGVAKPNPKMGQALGPLGINMMKFCE
jgi:hypothetical protein